MPNLTLTIQENSPLLSFDSQWNAGGSDDGQASNYVGSHFMRTSVGNAKMTFQYNGTDVSLFGAMRGNHGRYQVTIDNSNTPVVANGSAPDPGIYKALLFQSQGLSQGPHTLTLTNLDDKLFVDIDFVSWNVVYGDPKADMALDIIDDIDRRWKWSGNDWTTSPPIVGSWFAGTGHVTTVNGATAQIPFFGDGISLYGPVNTSTSPFSIRIDDGQSTGYNAATKTLDFQTLLFHANNLGTGNHTLTLTCQPQAQQSCGVDYVQVYRVKNSTGSSGGSSGTTSGSTDTTVTVFATNSSLSTGDIVGITLGSIAIAVALVILAFYIMLRKGSKGSSPYEPAAFTRVAQTDAYPATQGGYQYQT